MCMEKFISVYNSLPDAECLKTVSESSFATSCITITTT